MRPLFVLMRSCWKCTVRAETGSRVVSDPPAGRLPAGRAQALKTLSDGNGILGVSDILLQDFSNNGGLI